MREQIAQQPPRRRASLPPEEHTASWHHVGTRSGMHPEDQPYMTTTRNCYHAPTTATSIEVDEEGEEVYTRPPSRTSARRYDLAPYRHGRGERQTEELLRQGKHPLFYIGICLVILVVFLTAYTLIPPALQKWTPSRVLCKEQRIESSELFRMLNPENLQPSVEEQRANKPTGGSETPAH